MDRREVPALRSSAALSAFEAIRLDLLASVAGSPDPDAAVIRWESLIARLPSAINLFRLLEARPGLFALIADCLTLAPPMADELARRPDLLDALIDRTAFDLPAGVAELADTMRRRERGDDYEMRLDRLRVITGETRFALAVQLIEAAAIRWKLRPGWARTAEAALQVAVEAAEEEFVAKHGRIAGCELIVLGLGRFGGGLLTHASDLDIIYLFTGTHEGESDGPRPFGATLYFNRLAQRVTAALSVPTAQGALYEVDTRLRPQGAQGPLAVSIDSFARYQREDAWSWEHMALTRARALVGSDRARDTVCDVVLDILCRTRDVDARAMCSRCATRWPRTNRPRAHWMPSCCAAVSWIWSSSFIICSSGTARRSSRIWAKRSPSWSPRITCPPRSSMRMA